MVPILIMALNLATDLRDQSRYAEVVDKQGEIKLKSNASIEEVLSLLRHALTIKLETTGMDQMKLAKTYDLIGIALTKTGNYDQALTMFQRGMNARTAIVGHEHPDVGDSYLYVADVCYIIGRFLICDSMYRSAIGIYIQGLPETHAKIIASYDGIVKARIKLKKFDDAMEMKEIADKLRRKAEQRIRCQTPSESSSPADTGILDHRITLY